MERWRGQALFVAVAAIATLVSGGAAAQGKLKAEIIRSKGGIPTIRADSFKDMGFGYGYAFAEDNICTMAQSYVTSNAERSKYFGPDGESPEGYTNLESDLFYQRIKDRGIIDQLLAQPPPVGPKPKLLKGVKGYVAGYNRYLRKTGVANLPDPTCAGAPWVREITVEDAYRRFYQLGQLASGQIAEDGIVNAAPPGSARSSAADSTVTPADVAELGEALDAQRGDTGSNGWGIGSDATENGSGMVLGNPHFPWQGSERFYQSHLVIPGKVNVSGASLFGVPVINIGHTDNLAWTHTVSTAFRFVPMALTLVPGDPTSYLVDGQPEKMETNDVTVQTLQPDGSLVPVTRTLYTTRYGPIITSLQGQELFDWTNTTAYAMFDANAENLRLPQPLLRHQQGAVDQRAARHPQEVRGHPVGEHDGLGLARQGALRRHRLGPQRAERQGDRRLLRRRSARSPSGPSGCRRSTARARSARRARTPTRSCPGSSAPRTCRPCSAATTSPTRNDSYWLANPAQPLEGFARIIGDEQTERSLRERLGLTMIQQRLAGEDGYAGDKFTVNRLRRIQANDRLYGAELFRSSLAAFCHANPNLVNSDGAAVDVSAACPALDGFDEHQNLDSTGAILFRRWFSNLDTLPFTTPFDVADPINTPAGLDTSDPTVGEALADAVTDLNGAGIPLDAPLGTYQYEPRGAENIPIHGGPSGQGAFNVISDAWDPPAGYPDVTDGSSFIMVAGFNKEGRCVRDRTILTYSESANPSSKHYADQTKLFSQKKWIDPPFCPGQVEKAARSTKVIRSG